MGQINRNEAEVGHSFMRIISFMVKDAFALWLTFVKINLGLHYLILISARFLYSLMLKKIVIY